MGTTTSKKPFKEDLMYERIAALEAYKHMKALLERLGRMIRKEDADLAAYVAELPLRAREEELPVRIVPREYTERQAARQRAAEIITATVSRENQDPSTVWRAPGLLAASEETLALAREVNSAKQAFKQAVQNISPVLKVRVKQMRRVVHYIALMQCYRAIPILEERPQAVHFTWAVNSARSKQRTVAEWLEVIEQLHGDPWEGYELHRWEDMLAVAERNLSALPADELIVQRQPVAPHPRANVWFGDTMSMFRVSLPLLYPDDGDEIIPYKPLGVADRRIRRTARRNRVIEEEPLSRLLHLYRYRRETDARK